MIRRLVIGAAAIALGSIAAPSLLGSAALAEEESAPLLDAGFSFHGMFGTIDKASAQRGLQVYKEVCSNCHALSYIAFRNLGDAGGPGYSPAQVAAFASEYKIKDGPNDQGDMFERPFR